MDIGIDLGTTFSVIAVPGRVELSAGYPAQGEYLEECDVTIIPMPDASQTFPSVLWEDPDNPGELVSGMDAKQAAERGGDPILWSKRKIGTTELLPMGTRQLTAKAVATEVLKALKQAAEQALGQPVRRAVVTHPAYFDRNQVDETRLAAQAAGFDMALPEQMLMEPVAAALAYVRSDERDPLKVMIYDLGGGTFDVTILERRGGVINVKAFDGDHLLGGANFDRKLMQWLLARLQEKGRRIPYDEANPEHRGWRAQLLQLMEQTKERLSRTRTKKQKVDIRCDFLLDEAGRRVQVLEQITQEEFVALIREELDVTLESSRRCLEKADLQAEDLDYLLLVGGSTYGPWVDDSVREAFAGVDIIQFRPDLCVAAGAAIQARLLVLHHNLAARLSLLDSIEPFSKDASIVVDEVIRSIKKNTVNDLYVILSDSQSTIDIKEYLVAGEPHPEIKKFEIPEIIGHFKRKEMIGRGAFSWIYLAEDMTSHLNRQVVLKVPKMQKAKEKWIISIQHEANIWKKLSDFQNINILALEDLRTVEGITFFVMEYIPSGSLADALRAKNTKEKVEYLSLILASICDGLAFVHSKKVVHGDIKPQNILVASNTQAKIGDFGLSIDISSAQSAQELIGVLPFLAPESFDGRKTFATDIYAFGATLYYLLTTDYPFPDPASFEKDKVDLQSLATRRLSFKPKFEGEASDIPPQLQDLIKRCMAPNPADRFVDAQDLLEHIRPILQPSDENPVIMTASRDIYNKTIEFDLDYEGKRDTEIMAVDISDYMIEDIVNTLGKLDNKRRQQMIEHASHFILGPQIRERLSQAGNASSLKLVYDPRSRLGDIPWESLLIDGKPLAHFLPFSRSPKLHKRNRPPVAQQGEKLKILLINNPTGDVKLDKTDPEIKAIRKLFESSRYKHFWDIEEVNAWTSPFELRSKIRECDILHFSGHGLSGKTCGLLLKGLLDEPKDVLCPTELEKLWIGRPPLLVFANACFSTKPQEIAAQQERIRDDSIFGLAHAMLSSGVTNYIGSLWQVPEDDTVIEFARRFYEQWLLGRTIAQAVHHVRCSLAKDDPMGSHYWLFGETATYLPGVKFHADWW